MLALKASLLSYMETVADMTDSGETTRTVELYARGGSERKGQVQLKWWKSVGMLIVKQVELQRDTTTTTTTAKGISARPEEHRREFLFACALLLADPNAQALGLCKIRMEAVSSEKLARALKQEGWSVPDPFYCGANADCAKAGSIKT